MPKDDKNNNSIDELLDSMFRGGRLNLRGAQPEQAAGGKALARDAERMAREAEAELDAMRARLKKGGIGESTVQNAGPGEKLAEAFDSARRETGEKVLGQDAFLDALTLALKRPFVVGRDDALPLGRIAVLGKQGTGRHTALEVLTTALGRRGVLKSPKLVTVDLARYSDSAGQKLFLQDLYAAVKAGASGLVFERFEAAGPAVRSLLSQLFRTGRCSLPGRYVEQKGILVDVGNALAPAAISEISAAGRYLILLSQEDPASIGGRLGTAFLASLDDVCATADFTPEALLAIAKKELGEQCVKARKQLKFTLSYDASAAEALAACFTAAQGAGALEAEAEKLYRALSEEKLRRGLGALSGKVTGEGGVLTARLELPDGPLTVRAEVGKDQAAREEALRAVKQELDEIVGLQEVKEYVLSLEDNFAIQQMRAAKGFKAEAPSMHMIFTGNPGTGKTTVARLVAKYLKAIGVLTGGQLVEVTRADLVGRYVGHTAPLTRQAIESALGGVLFIDEAYSLYRGKDDSFGLEAIDTLVKGMEDHRDRLVVILAGYTYEMEEFLTANSGLKSRFPNVIEFPDYTAQELLEITQSIVRGKGYRLAEDCDGPLLAYYQRQQTQGDPRTSGNGRMARNKVEEAILNCSRRNLPLPEKERDLELLLPEDFSLD